MSLAKKAIRTMLAPLRGLGLRRFSIVRRALGALKENITTAHGHIMYLDPSDFAVSEEISTGGYEAGEVEIVRALVRASDTVLDVGANIGYFTILCSSIAKDGRVYSFEPSQQTFSFLKRNIESNHFANAQAHQIAIGDREGEAMLYINQFNKGDNRLYDSFGATGVNVRIRTLDSVLPPGTRVDLIKMDIQGYETHALRGAQRVLSESPDVIMLIEFWPKGLARAGSSAGELLTRLRSEGFTWALIDEDAPTARRILDTDLVAKYPPQHDAYGNLLCWKNRQPPASVLRP